MTQSATLVACLLAAFVLFIAARGRLGAYGAALFGKAPAAPNVGGSSSGGSSSGGTVGRVLDTLGTASDIAMTIGV